MPRDSDFVVPGMCLGIFLFLLISGVILMDSKCWNPQRSGPGNRFIYRIIYRIPANLGIHVAPELTGSSRSVNSLLNMLPILTLLPNNGVGKPETWVFSLSWCPQKIHCVMLGKPLGF